MPTTMDVPLGNAGAGEDEGVDDGVATDVPETLPVYQYRTWSSRGQSTEHDRGMECTSAGFCFVCHTTVMDRSDTIDGAGAADPYADPDEDDDDDDGDDDDKDMAAHVKAIQQYITINVEQHKPVSLMVDGIADYYKRRVQPHVPDYFDPVDMRMVPHPEWTKETIVRHLMFTADPSGSQVFGQACTLMLRGLVLKANEATVDKATKRINSEAAKSLCDFIDRHNRHMRDQLVLADLVAKSKARRAGGYAGKGRAAVSMSDGSGF